jgi:hypothetical protein
VNILVEAAAAAAATVGKGCEFIYYINSGGTVTIYQVPARAAR